MDKSIKNYQKWLLWIAVGLCFLTATFLFGHNLKSISEDIGRHIKLGEIIWQTKSVPHTNLLSYTATDFPFINHHWLSEVLFYGFYHTGGLVGVMIASIIILLATYLILFLIIQDKLNGIAIASFLISLALVSDRADPRPEIFTYLILATFLYIIYRVRADKNGLNLLWLLPPLELLWVNLHIYFILGFVLYGAFLVEQLFLKKLNYKEIAVGIAMVLVALINPNGIRGLIYPFMILNDYGLAITENYSILEIVKHYQAWVFPYKLFLASALLMLLGLILKIRKLKNYIFELIIFTFFVISAFKLSRNTAIYSIFSLPATIALFGDFNISQKFPKLNKTLMIGLIIFSVYFINLIRTNSFYKIINTSTRFGLSVPKSMEQATDFLQDNHVPGPIFNDINIGSYLEWKLYPEQKAFSDNRPEAYPKNFWLDTYKPMQYDYKIWQQKSTEYGIRSVIFDHTTLDPAGQKFLSNILKDPGWPLIFLNDKIVIFVKKSSDTQHLIDAYMITDKNVELRIRETTDTFDPSYDLSYLWLGNFLYKIGQYQASLIPYQRLIYLQPDNPSGYEKYATVLIAKNDSSYVNPIIENLQKAISLGTYNEADDYYLLSYFLSYTGNTEEARAAIKKAHSLDPDNDKIKSLYEQLIK